MDTQVRFEKCSSFLSSEWWSARATQVHRVEREPRLAVTLSRQTGSGAHVVGEQLAEFLSAHAPTGGPPWTLFDRNLAGKVLADHHLPDRWARFMPEDRTSGLSDIVDELFGLHPPVWTLVDKTAATILRMAEQGNVILIGRGANLITQKLGHVFHVRLVGSLERRVAHIQEERGLDHAAALRFIAEEDHGRQRYFRRYFGKRLDDPLLYHLFLNTDLVPYEETARIIGEAALNHLRRQAAGRPAEPEAVHLAAALP